MTVEERLAAVERELLEHQRELRKLRDLTDAVPVSRVERVETQLDQTKRVLPDMQILMKKLEEANIVTNHMEARQALALEEHAEWLQAHDRAIVEMRENARLAQAEARERDRAFNERFAVAQAEARERGQVIDERIDKLVSAMGELIRGRNGKQKS